MTKKLKMLMAAACLGLMMMPGMIVAAGNDAATPSDNGQMMNQASPNSADNPEASGNAGSSDENAMPEDGQGSDDAAPSDDGSTDGGSMDEPSDAPEAE